MVPEVRNVPKGPSEIMGGRETEGGRARLWPLSLAVQEVTCESETSWFLGHPSDQRTGFLRGEARHSLPRCFCSTQRTRTTGCGHPLSPPPPLGHQAGLHQRHIWRVLGRGRDLVSAGLIGLTHQDSSTVRRDSGGERKPTGWPAGVSRPAPAMSFPRSPTRKWVSRSSPFSC